MNDKDFLDSVAYRGDSIDNIESDAMLLREFSGNSLRSFTSAQRCQPFNLMEGHQSNEGDTSHRDINPPNHTDTILKSTSSAPTSFNYSRDKRKEIIHDKSELAVYIIDNSKSMEYYHDGKTFESIGHSANKRIIKRSGVLRWHEAVSKITKIAKYNISRRICASYYLLNPIKKSSSSEQQGTHSWIHSLNPFGGASIDFLDWRENVDCIKIDAQDEDDGIVQWKYKILIQRILSADNIRGNTPLDVITRYFGRNLPKFVDSKRCDLQNKAICFNIVTDGEPNDKNKFEKELRYLAKTFNIFLAINLCTDDDAIVKYYNDLDTKIGQDLSGFDVLDDFESEQREVLLAGNDFFVYSEDVHICRMAGCYSVIADLMDEQKLIVYHACKLCEELCGLYRRQNDELPNFNDRHRYIECIKTMIATKDKVYDFKNQQLSKIINVQKLDALIWINEPCDNQLQYVWKLMVYHYPIVIFVAIVLIVLIKFPTS